jgi:hypothetical protein
VEAPPTLKLFFGLRGLEHRASVTATSKIL